MSVSSRRLVLDASAAIRVVLGAEGAIAIAETLEICSLVLVPELYCSEVANGLWKYVSAGDLDRSDSIERLEEALGLADRIVPDRTLAVEALSEAGIQDHPVYDLIYLALARRYGCTLASVDIRLRRLAGELAVDCIEDPGLEIG